MHPMAGGANRNVWIGFLLEGISVHTGLIYREFLGVTIPAGGRDECAGFIWGVNIVRAVAVGARGGELHALAALRRSFPEKKPPIG